MRGVIRIEVDAPFVALHRLGGALFAEPELKRCAIGPGAARRDGRLESQRLADDQCLVAQLQPLHAHVLRRLGADIDQVDRQAGVGVERRASLVNRSLAPCARGEVGEQIRLARLGGSLRQSRQQLRKRLAQRSGRSGFGHALHAQRCGVRVGGGGAARRGAIDQNHLRVLRHLVQEPRGFFSRAFQPRLVLVHEGRVGAVVHEHTHGEPLSCDGARLRAGRSEHGARERKRQQRDRSAPQQEQQPTAQTQTRLVLPLALLQ